ncbi:terminase small subunit [Streptococcus vestibularis]|uniref:terminase small subunit n=1 Tax=Streptococcus vestibularis TaxID=1343 RepID=UPI00232C363B|nr:terminase small subunit [Streptococcus vestibularis]MDB6183817.1 terminase small subunit [Streptococcus vestibularis]MDB6202046.1 terminase small subunit [Streptococcus vestibularis]MDB6207973.1 terminase small subunit [Streptococcus vestibularis]MDB6211781.1 terminase small subunit [Streptococcus vestibularis]MDB6215800.1 terminase small subunit [Streptococcus vestibularis]
MDIGLNQRQKLFADEYLISGIAYNAALKAGYSEKYAKARSHDLLDKCRNQVLYRRTHERA